MTVDLNALSNRWQHMWPQCPPIGHDLPQAFPDRWVRFHALPGSKRYADTPAEYETILGRHYTLLRELDAAASPLLLITCDWTETADAVASRWPRRSEVDPDAQRWQTVVEDPGDPEDTIYTQIYVSRHMWRPRVFDTVLRAVADDEIAGVTVAPESLDWLYHPYDGGMDLILPNSAQRDLLKHRHSSWLSSHHLGL